MEQKAAGRECFFSAAFIAGMIVMKAQYKLLESMAIALGYKDKITWETIQNPYIPDGLVIQLEAQKTSQQKYMDVLDKVSSIMPVVKQQNSETITDE